MTSVIIPIYNVEKYLRDCLNSVINQTYKDLEIILVDDGSPDKCGEICDEYANKDERIRVIHKKNGGLSDARNAGFSISHGDYIYFLDSDDYIIENAIEKMVSCIEKEKADIVFFDSDTLYEDFPDPNYREYFVRSNCYRTEKGSHVLRKQIGKQEYYSCVQFHFFRRSLLEKNKLKFVKDMMHEDELFTVLAYIRAERVAQLNEIVYVKRLRANSIMSERISVKSIAGMYRCIIGYAHEENKYLPDSIESKVLKIRIRDMSQALIHKFVSVEKKNRMIAKKYVEKTSRILHQYGFFKCKKLYLQYSFPKMYMKYNSIRELKRF